MSLIQDLSVRCCWIVIELVERMGTWEAKELRDC